jgi:hypothetical protein
MDYRDAFQYFRPGFRLDAERARRVDAGQPEWFGENDLYPDVRPSMAALRDMGVWVGVAGNQTSRAPVAALAVTAGDTGPRAGWDVSGRAPAQGGVKPSSATGR